MYFNEQGWLFDETKVLKAIECGNRTTIKKLYRGKVYAIAHHLSNGRDCRLF